MATSPVNPNTVDKTTVDPNSPIELAKKRKREAELKRKRQEETRKKNATVRKYPNQDKNKRKPSNKSEARTRLNQNNTGAGGRFGATATANQANQAQRKADSLADRYINGDTSITEAQVNAAQAEADKWKAKAEKLAPKQTVEIKDTSGNWIPYGTANAPDTIDNRAKTTSVEKVPTTPPPPSAQPDYWANAFYGTQQDGGLVLIKGDNLNSAGSYSFLVDKTGNVYRDSIDPNKPESLESAKQRIGKELAASGKLNEFRDLLIAKKIANPTNVTILTNAKTVMSNFADQTTLDYIGLMVSQASQHNASIANGAKGKPELVSFEDFVKTATPKSLNINNTPSGGGSGYSLPKRTVTTTKQKFTTHDFEIAIDDLYQKTTGRGASKEEVQNLVDFLNKQNPQKSVSVRHGNNTSTTVTGGVTQDMIQEEMRTQALNDPNAENYNKATKYMGYFMNALNSPIKLG